MAGTTHNIAVMLSANATTFRGQMAQASAAVKGFEKDADGLARGASKWGMAIKAGFAVAAIAAAAFFAVGVSNAIKFEAAMRNVNSISKLSEERLAAVGDQVVAMSTRMPQSAQTLAEGLYEIASSGFQGAEGIKILEAAGYAASAGLSTTEVSAKALTAVLNAYGLEASSVADVSDVLFQTVNLGVVSFEQLASELGDVVGGAAAAGVAIDEVGAAIAAMTLSGIGAAEATTSLNRLIQAVIDPSEALKVKFQELGYESGKSALDTLGLHGTMELLRESTGGNIETLLALFPEIRAARGAFALMAADGENYANTFAGIADETARAGATQAAFDEQMRAVGNQWRLFTNQVSAAGIRLGTWFLPILGDGIASMQAMGRTIGDLAASAGRALAPAWDSLVDAGQAVASVLDTILDTALPVGRALLTIGGAAAIGAVTALAEALQQTAEFLAENETLVRGLALVVGGVLLSRLVAAGAALVQFQAHYRALLLWETLGPIFSNLASRARLFGEGLYAVFSMGNLGNIGKMREAFAGLGSVLTSPAFVATGFLAGMYAIQSGLSNAKSQAQELRAELTRDVDPASIDSVTEGLNAVGEELERVTDEYRASYGEGTNFRAVLKGTVELLTPMKNGLADGVEGMEALRKAEAELMMLQADWTGGLAIVQSVLGVTAEEAARLAEAVQWDPATQTQHEFLENARELKNVAENGTPAQLGLNEAMLGAADAAATAEDRVQAMADAIDALIGIQLGAWDATTKFAETVQALTDSIAENGVTFDAWTEAGRANRDALSANITAMTEMAVATANQSGNLQDGVNQLTMYRQGLIDQLGQLGMNKAEAEALVDSLGLMPENIETLLELNGAETAQRSVDVFKLSMDALAQLKVGPQVTLDTADFEGDALAVADVLIQIGMANPEATVLMDDELFQATAAQVQLWSETWDDSTPQAQALLDIIDPQGKYATLSEAAFKWDATATTADANLNGGQATSLFDVLSGRISLWGATSRSATASVNDYASAILKSVEDRLNVLNGKVATASIIVTETRRVTVGQGGSGGAPMRWGGVIGDDGVIAAASGFQWSSAQVVNKPTMLFGERETGGEAYVPRLGNYQRSMGILAKAASWYDADVVARNRDRAGGGGGAGGMSYSPTVSVQITAHPGVDRGDLSQLVSKAVGDELDRHDKYLLRQLGSR